MTVEAQLWQLILAALVPTSGAVFAAGGQYRRIQQLESQIKELRHVVEAVADLRADLREIKTDVAWIKDRNR